jgi:hypothetical protein
MAIRRFRFGNVTQDALLPYILVSADPMTLERGVIATTSPPDGRPAHPREPRGYPAEKETPRTLT